MHSIYGIGDVPVITLTLTVGALGAAVVVMALMSAKRRKR